MSSLPARNTRAAATSIGFIAGRSYRGLLRHGSWRSSRHLADEFVGAIDRGVHVLDQAGNVSLEFGGFASDGGDSLSIEGVLEREQVIVQLSQHGIHALLGFFERGQHLVVTLPGL